MQINWPQGIDQHLFLQQYWQQKPLLIKNAFPEFSNPLDENELAGLALDDDANSRFIECVDEHEWRMSHGPFDESFFDNISSTQWSLLISDVEKLLPDFRVYLEPFRFLPDWRIDDLMISYAPTGGSVGAHIDQYDVFLLQASGVRQWQFETTARESTTHDPLAAIAMLGDFTADETHRLGTGDMLYLPPKFAHHGIAAEDPCMTWSIGFRAPSADEMLPSLISYLLDESVQPPRFSDSGRTVTDSPGKIAEHDFNALRKLIRTALSVDDAVLDRCIGRYLSERTAQEQPAPLQLSTQDIFNRKKTPAMLVCNSEHSVSYKSDDHNTLLFANGECFDVSLPLAIALSEQRKIATSDIIDADHDTVVALMNQHTLLEDDEC